MHNKTYICKYCLENGVVKEFDIPQALAGHIRMSHPKSKRKKKKRTMEQLLLDLLLYLCKTGETRKEYLFTELAKILGCNIDTVKRFVTWLKASKYHDIVKFILNANKNRSENPNV